MLKSLWNERDDASKSSPWPLRHRASTAVAVLPSVRSNNASTRNNIVSGTGGNDKHRRRRGLFAKITRQYIKIACAVLSILILLSLVKSKRRNGPVLINNVPLPPATSWQSLPAPTGEIDRDALEQQWNSHKDGIPHNLWFTYSNNILETKEPKQYYDNVLNSIDKYAASFLQKQKASPPDAMNKVDDNHQVRVTCMDDAYCETLIYHVAPLLTTFFLTEMNGSFKGDICRVAALYKFGGYYFDVDMEVIEPYIAPMEAKNGKGDIFFTTAWDVSQRSFFQSFMGCSPGHPIVAKALDLMLQHYKGERPEWKGTIIMGPVTLEEAYRQHTGSFKAGDTRLNDARLQPYSKDHQRLMATTTFMLKEVNLYTKLFRLARRTTGAGDLCNMIVINPNTKVPHFYSRIVGSSNCPYQGWRERFRRVFPHGTCGGGHVGNGMCFNSFDCCSKFGYCGTKKEYCEEKSKAKRKSLYSINVEKKWQKVKSTVLEWWGIPTCGGGEVGNRMCPEPKACCSKFGWCGLTEEFCNPEYVKHNQKVLARTDNNKESTSSHPTSPCGEGHIGHGKCHDPTACCSKHGWCGYGPEFCFPCGSGKVGNGICPSPDACCSRYGWCGVGDEFCKSGKKA
jgi:hypothetical protein